MASETAGPGQEWVVLASFGSRQRAEYMLASLGRGFRGQARKGGTAAVVIRGNTDASLRLTQSYVLTANGFVSTLLRVCFSWAVGFMGLLSTVKGAKVGVHAAGVRNGHVGSGEQQADRILAEAGPRAVITLIRGTDTQSRPVAAAAAADRATYSWDDPLAEFLAALDPGSAPDWVRSAVADAGR